MTKEKTTEFAGYSLYGPKVGYYAKYQPDYNFSFTHDIEKAQVWKTISFDHHFYVIREDYDPDIKVVKIAVKTTVTEEEAPGCFADELKDWETLSGQYESNADGMSEANYNLFKTMKKVADGFGFKEDFNAKGEAFEKLHILAGKDIEAMPKKNWKLYRQLGRELVEAGIITEDYIIK